MVGISRNVERRTIVKAAGVSVAALGLEVAARMRAAGHEVLDLTDESYAAARDRALGAVAQGIDLLAVVGGDGMAHLGINLAAETKVPLAPIAAGTGNDIARGLGLPLHDPVRAADLVTTGVPRTIDAIRALDHVQWRVDVSARVRAKAQRRDVGAAARGHRLLARDLDGRVAWIYESAVQDRQRDVVDPRHGWILSDPWAVV